MPQSTKKGSKKKQKNVCIFIYGDTRFTAASNMHVWIIKLNYVPSDAEKRGKATRDAPSINSAHRLEEANYLMCVFSGKSNR